MVSRPPTAADSRRLKVLVIDDDDLVNRLLSRALDSECEVTSVRTAADARRAVEETTFDAVLCDLLLGPENGAILAADIVADRPHYEGRIVLMTGAVPGRELVKRVTALGYQILSKPFDRLQALAALREAAGVGAGPVAA